MATIVFQGYALDDAGAAIVGATVHIYARNTVTPALEDVAVTTDANGLWTATQTLVNDGTDLYDIEIVSGSSKRRRKYDDKIQLNTLEAANLYLRNPANTYRYNLVPAAIVADRQLTLPLLTATETVAVLGAGGLAQAFSAVQSIGFPATQAASADANTLDDYEEGTWTPVITAAVPGNLSVAYSYQNGKYTKIGEMVFVTAFILTTTFTHTTASGDFLITGLPFTALGTPVIQPIGAVGFGGFTKTNYTQLAAVAEQNTTQISMYASGSGQARVTAAITDFPTGGTVGLILSISYWQKP